MKKQLIATSIVALMILAQSAAQAGAPEFPGRGNKKDWQRASKTYDQALSQRKRGNIDGAIKLYEQAINIYPYDGDFYCNLAIHYARDKKDLDRAQQLINKAVELKPKNYSFQWERAAILLAQGKLEAAKQVLLSAQKLTKTAAQETELNETLVKIEAGLKG